MESEVGLKAIEANPVSSMKRVSNEIGLLQSSVVCRLHCLDKAIRAAELCLTLIECKNILYMTEI